MEVPVGDFVGMPVVSRATFWVLYDYGQGGLWAIMSADSGDEIRARYPQLQVYEASPTALDEDTRQRILLAGVQDIDGPMSGWLKDLAAYRPEG